jgi:hypothetical protein
VLNLYEQSLHEDDILEQELLRRVPDAWHKLEHDINVEEP